MDHRHTDLALAQWSEGFLALGRRLPPGTQETWGGHLSKYVLPA